MDLVVILVYILGLHILFFYFFASNFFGSGYF